MQLEGLIYSLPKQVKIFCTAFIVALSIGYYSGLLFVSSTTENTPKGIEENYLGNEDDTETDTLKFKKGKREMLTTFHTHVLSISFIFFLQGCILLLTAIPKKLKTFLLVEPFVSVITTFGFIYVLWLGNLWAKYIVIISGFLMTFCFTLSTLIILKQLIFPKKEY